MVARPLAVVARPLAVVARPLAVVARPLAVVARPLAVLAAVLAAAPAAGAAPRRPDLAASAPRIVGARTLEPGAALTIAYTVANRGRRRAPPSRARLRLVRAGHPAVRLVEPRVARLARGGVARGSVEARVPEGLAPGAWRLVACADARRRVRERRERNNCRAALLPLRVPAPPVPEPPPVEQPPPADQSADARVDDQPLPIPIPLLTPPSQPGPRPTTPASVTDCEPDIPAATAPAEEFTSMFAATETGWTGGDGTFSVELPDGTTAWWFGDTFLGGLTSLDGRDQPYPDVRNTAVLQGLCLTTRFRGTLDFPNHFEPTGEDTTWYWPNQPVVHGDEVRVFWTKMEELSGGATYAADGVSLATYDLDLDRVTVAEEVPALTGQWWGAALADDGAHTYVFGVRNVSATENRVYLARAPLQDLDGAWEYRTATGWSTALADAAPVLTDPGHISTQLSVLREGTGWALVSQDPLGSTVNVWRATEPWTWGARETVTTLETVLGGRTYNALVHPQFTAGGELLISYNVIADEPTLTMADAAMYRPRFVRAALP